MVQSQSQSKADKILNVQRIYFKISLYLIPTSILFYIIGAVFARTITATPEVIFYVVTYLFYYHIAHFFFGFFSIFYYAYQIRKKIITMKLYKTIIGIVLTPISAIIMYAALLLMALTQCAA